MREIKFRAKSFDQNKMVYFSLYDVTNYFPGDDVFYVGNIPFKVGSEQEYTGLKDKNGKEIYEGDIITAGYWGTVGYYGEDTFIVEFADGAFRGFMLKYRKNKKEKWSHSTPLYKLKNLEVIGNIYENKDLLNEQNKD